MSQNLYEQETDVQLNRFPRIHAAICRVLGNLPGVDRVTIDANSEEIGPLAHFFRVILISANRYESFVIEFELEDHPSVDEIVSIMFRGALGRFRSSPPGRGAAWSDVDDKPDFLPDPGDTRGD
jgi:hypothetical protein